MLERHPYFFLSVFLLLLGFMGMRELPVIDRDEAHFAQATRQMLQTGNFFQIRFQERTRFQKPPGINWLQAVSVALLSQANSTAIWPYRLPSVLSALFSVLLFFYFAKQWTNQRVAWTAAFLLATSLLFMIEAHMAVIDAPLLLAIVLMQGALGQLYLYQKSKFWVFCFWSGMIFGVLLKGVTLLVGSLTLVALGWGKKQWRWMGKLSPLWGFLCLLFIIILCLYLLNLAEGRNYLVEMLNRDLLPKLQGGHESHGKPPLFHLFILPLTFWPGSLFLWQGFKYAHAHRKDLLVSFLLAWMLPTWIFFEMMPTKLPQYMLPTFPPLALLCALGIEHYRGRLISKKCLTLQVLWGIFSLLLLGFLAWLAIDANYKSSIIAVSLGIFLVFLILTSVYWVSKQQYYHALYLLGFLAAFSYSLALQEILPRLHSLWLSKKVVSALGDHILTSEKPLLAVGFSEPSLVFNLNTDLVRFVSPQAAKKIIEKDLSRWVLVDRLTYESWAGDPQMSVLTQINGFNYSKGKWINLFLLKREKFNVAF